MDQFMEQPGLATVALASAAVLTLSVAVLIYRRKAAEPVSSGLTVAAQKQGTVQNGQRPSLEDPKRPRIRILYGTQTGTAERFSKQLGGELRKKYGDALIVDVLDLENYRGQDQLPREKLVVMCVATYGDGEPTDNAAEFFSWLGKEVEAVEAGEKQAYLEGCSFAVFGLGNKQYEHFNAMGKKAFKALQALGGKPLVRRGDGDDDGCIDDDWDKWCGELFPALAQVSDLVGCADQNGSASTAIEVAAYDVEVLPAGIAEVPPFALGGTGKDHHSPYWAPITTARELHTSQSDRSCIHAEIDISGAGVRYEAGDHVAVYAQNSAPVVEEVAKLLGTPADTIIQLKAPAGAQGLAAPLPGPISLRTALAYFADVLSCPHKEALAALSTFASNKAEAERLAKLASHEGKADYAEFISKPHRSLLEVLRAFPSAKPSLGAFFGCIAPRLQPRFYSISSSPRPHPASVHVTCALVRDTMPTGRIHEGVASTWLARQKGVAGTKVPVFIRHSNFKLPKDATKPVVMVGPGTGLAPFRGFLQERLGLATSGAKLGPAVLFFGCRNRAHDYIYEQELAGFLEGGALTSLHVAFSRHGAAKDYVQHHLERQAGAVWELLGEQGGYLYVCGDAKHMAKDVHKALIAIVQGAKQCSGTQAEAWVKQFTDEGRYQRDVW
eukprot:CAMPEP_0202864656 /NCGR_PEP_ID=MMETSP1391-20130828/4809_1 /ASSEMBLY_ACC=CAM_ASM_000867 /TAXON_ID=1034604 /ORGANISM="Chlamydomonas leiostraca, Strain SAG 11-49" /LENGTH=667 /DNA_ID=CAMNT_0049544423 /DNA_START=66 /DNA_END=2069 /DNA_ORIENTATION=-